MPPRATADISTLKLRQRVKLRLIGKERRIYVGTVSAVDSKAVKLAVTHNCSTLQPYDCWTGWHAHRETVVLPWHRIAEIEIMGSR
jgi:hypothetical protein